MAITKKSMDMVIEQVKDFFKNLLNPNMKIEDIADVVSSRLDPVIIEHEKNGLHFSAGKFYIKAPDDKHFQLEFEIFFKDDDDKWHKLANQSELRDIDLLEKGAAITIQKLKSIEFPINAPEIETEDKAEDKAEVKQIAPAKTAEDKDEDGGEVTVDVTNVEIDKTKSETKDL